MSPRGARPSQRPAASPRLGGARPRARLRRVARAERGISSLEVLVGTLVAALALLAALSLAARAPAIARAVLAAGEGGLDARWAMARIERELALAGRGVGPDDDPDEALELLEDDALGLRADLDGDRIDEASDPESVLHPAGRFVATGADELVVYLRRPAGEDTPALDETPLHADLHSSDLVPANGGELVARRDGVVERLDAGPRLPAGDTTPGVLARVSFSSRGAAFPRRVVTPLLDDVVAFRVRALDRDGRELPACGGLDGADARACRAEARVVLVELELLRGGRRERHQARVRLEEPGR